MIDFQAGNLVKICGLMDAAAAQCAVNVKADLLGFVFAESRRRASPELIRSVRKSSINGSDSAPPLVGVTVNMPPRDAMRLAEEAGLDMLQLSGNESPAVLDDLEVPVIKTIHVTQGTALDDIIPIVEAWFDHSRPAVAVLVDAKLPGVYGGSGTQADWTVAARLAERYPTILAGGLKPGNVFEGIHSVAPRGVDVSSGVEIDDHKDLALIEAFVTRARQGFDARLDVTNGVS